MTQAHPGNTLPPPPEDSMTPTRATSPAATKAGVVTALRRLEAAAIHRWYNLRLGSLGPGAVVDRRSHIDYASNVRIGAKSGIRANVTLRANTDVSPGISIGDDCSILESCVLTANGGSIRIGQRSWLGHFCLIAGNGHVRIGNDVLIAANVTINTVSHHSNRCDIPIAEQGIYCDPVTVEDDVWIGIGATILQGVTVGRGAIIGAGALVTRDVPPFSVVVGTPARVVRNRRDATGEETDQ